MSAAGEGARHPLQPVVSGPGLPALLAEGRRAGLLRERPADTIYDSRGRVGCRPPWDVPFRAMTSPDGPPEALWLLFQTVPKPLALGAGQAELLGCRDQVGQPAYSAVGAGVRAAEQRWAAVSSPRRLDTRVWGRTRVHVDDQRVQPVVLETPGRETHPPCATRGPGEQRTRTHSRPLPGPS